jgi:hypothetical protein
MFVEYVVLYRPVVFAKYADITADIKTTERGQAWRCMSVIPGTREAFLGGSESQAGPG